jgi:GT2 family glycosyltransferase
MRARYKGNGIKKYVFEGKLYEIPSDNWVEIDRIEVFKKLRSHPSVFDVVSLFDIKPFEAVASFLRFNSNLLYCSDNLAMRHINKIPFIRHQAHFPETGEHVYRIIQYEDSNLARFAGVTRTINSLIYRSLGGIGDLVLTSPIVESAHKTYPKFKITYSCPEKFIELFETNPFIHRLIPYNDDIVMERWDVVSDLTRDCIKYEVSEQPNVKLNRSEVFSLKCGVELDNLPRPKVFLDKDGILEAKEELSDLNSKYKIGLVLESNAPVRNWPYFNEVRERILRDYDADVLEFCVRKPVNWNGGPRVFGVFGKSLREVAALLNECDLVVSPDTGLAHISSALRIPTIWVFTHIDGKVRTRGYDRVWIVQDTPEDCPAGQPCWYDIPCSDLPENQKELVISPPCAGSIPSDAVMERISQVLERPNLSYIIVYKDNLEVTNKCLGLIEKFKKGNEEIIIVDNGSEAPYCSDGSCAQDIVYIKNSENLGCIIGRNQGMRKAEGHFLLTLDNDQFISADTVHRLMNTEGDVVGVEGWSMDDKGWAFNINKGRGQLAYIGGGGMLIKKSVAEKIGYLTEDYAPAWFSDPDFCFKAIKSGFKVNYAGDCGVEHIGHATVNNQTDFNPEEAWERSHEIFVDRWSGFLEEQHKMLPTTELQKVIESKEPLLMVYMLSWRRVGGLKRILKSLLDCLSMPVVFKLRVQGAESLRAGDKAEVEELVDKFPNSEIVFTNGNEGTAGPRRAMVGDYLENYNIKYLLLADDDMTFTPLSLESAVAVGEKHKEFGGIGIQHKPWGFIVEEYDNGRVMKRLQLKEGINLVDVLGSGHSIFRRDAMRTAEIDTNYFVGAWDWDLTMQLYFEGWKMCIISHPSIMATNHSGGDAEYKKVRRSQHHKEFGRSYFLTKFRMGDKRKWLKTG